MKAITCFSLFSVIFFGPIASIAQTAIPATQQQWQQQGNLGFTENKGQVRDQYGNIRPDIQYNFMATHGLSIFIGNGSLHYQFSKPQNSYCGKFHNNISSSCDEEGSVQYDMYRMDVTLEGANPHAQVVAEERQNYYENYHTAYLNSGDSPVNSFGRITYKNIYPAIDFVLYIKDSHLEYDFVVNEGGNVSNIKISYNGATELQQQDGTITATTPLGKISEGRLYTYQAADNTVVASAFILQAA
jgi:hypothetical protein